MFLTNLLLLASLVVILALLRGVVVAAFRRRLFAVRNELFLYWVTTGRPFDDPGYTSMRHSINSTIRFAHRMTAAHIVPFWLTDRLQRRRNQPSPMADYNATLAARSALVVDPAVAARLAGFHRATGMEAMGLLLLGSPSGWLLLGGLMLFAAGAVVWLLVKRQTVAVSTIIEGMATRVLPLAVAESDT